MVKKAENYKWSSYAMCIGLTKEKLINSESILKYFRSRESYKLFVEQGIK